MTAVNLFAVDGAAFEALSSTLLPRRNFFERLIEELTALAARLPQADGAPSAVHRSPATQGRRSGSESYHGLHRLGRQTGQRPRLEAPERVSADTNGDGSVGDRIVVLGSVSWQHDVDASRSHGTGDIALPPN